MKEYLGDSVYADSDGFGITLTTENGSMGASNTIYMEPQVLTRLDEYRKQIAAMAAARASAADEAEVRSSEGRGDE